MFVAKVDSLQRLPHYTFQLSLRHPADNERQRHIHGCNRNKQNQFTSRVFLIYYSSYFKKEVVLYTALLSPG